MNGLYGDGGQTRLFSSFTPVKVLGHMLVIFVEIIMKAIEKYEDDTHTQRLNLSDELATTAKFVCAAR